MRLSQFSLSSPGPKRERNEDAIAFWEPADDQVRRQQGSVAIIADGVGGQSNGDVASQLAVNVALEVFRQASPSLTTRQILKEIFQRANLAIYESGMENPQGGRMATTLTVCIFRDRELSIGHVGDSRAYIVRNKQIKRLTDDHSYTGLQLKLRLITEHEARASNLWSMLTRTVGHEPVVRCDFKRIKLMSRAGSYCAPTGFTAL